jgi:hypothetical protein
MRDVEFSKAMLEKEKYSRKSFFSRLWVFLKGFLKETFTFPK